MQQTSTLLEQIAELYSAGQYLTALETAAPLGELTQWSGTRARVLAGRLANNLGAPRLGRALHLLAFREDPDDWEVRYFYIWSRFSRRGPLVAWQLMEQLGDPDEQTDRRWRADWLALKAHTLAMLRDFETADDLLARAIELEPQRPWIWVEKSGVLELEDQHDQSIAAARRALELRPFYRPAVQAAAHALVQMNCDDEAIALLEEASATLQSGDVVAQLSALQIELGRYEAARANLDRLEAFFPLMHHDKHRVKWLAARRADAAYYCGDFDEAARLAKESDSPFHKQLIERLSVRPLKGRRTELPVPFVRQHHNTCGPATLSSISQFWQHPVEQLEVVEKICYDGTPAHSERSWAEEHGFAAREFTITWDNAVALIDLGLPFTLTTVDPGNAHLQAVYGYDERRGSLLVRDPGERHFGEFLAEKMLEHYASSGPRGMVMVPQSWLNGEAAGAGDPPTDPRLSADGQRVDCREFSERFRAIELPDAQLHDFYFRIELALQRHDRGQARQIHNEMRELAPDHRLTIHARRAIAAYDADEPTMLKCAERLLKQFPDDVNLLMMKLSLLTQLGRREERLQMLEEICARADADPYFWQHLAHELSVDARQHDVVYHLLRRSMRYRPLDERGMGLLADVMWDKPEKRNDALQLYRFAACLGDRDENRAKSYFFASRHLKKNDEALQFLEDRFARFGAQKSWPAQTLVWAYEVLDRTEDAVETVERALKLRADDGELLLFAADFYSRYGRNEQARQLLEPAGDNSHRNAWLRTAAGIELNEGHLQAALDCWRRVLEAEPLARDANQMVAQLLADLQGQAAGLAHLRAAAQRFPHSYALRTLLLEWETEEGPENAEAASRDMLEKWPTDAYARRELAIALVRQRKWDDARHETELANELDPTHPLCQFLLGRIHQAEGRLDEAKQALRRSIAISVDYDPAIAALVEACDTQAEREAELQFIYEQLVAQVTFGEGLLSYREYAAGTLPPEQLCEHLRDAHRARPDLWQAHSALVMQLIDMQQLDEALEVAQASTRRFPLLPRGWADLALVHQARGDAASEIDALRRALEISPYFGEASRLLAEALLREGRHDEAKAVVDKAIAGEPRDIVNYGTLADVLWAMGKQDEAIDTLKKAVRNEPGYEYAWHRLRQWADELNRPGVVLESLRELTTARPNEARSWRMLADALLDPDDRDECLEALDRAIQLDPRDVESHSLKAYFLAEWGQFDEALAACRPEVFGDQPPLELRARAADVEASRGNYEVAVPAMQQVLRDDPNYAFGWLRLTGWYQEMGETDEYVRAAAELTRVVPRQPLAWAYCGDARQRAGDRDGAKRDFGMARQIDPTYSLANLSLLDLHLEDNEVDAAAEILHGAAEHLPPDYRWAQQVRIDMARADKDAAGEHLRQLCQCPLEDEEPLRLAVGAMLEGDAGADAYLVLEEQWNREEADPQVATVWVQLGAMAETLPQIGQQLEVHGPMWHPAAQQYMLELGRTQNKGGLRRFVNLHREMIDADDRTWADVGDALLQAGQPRQAIAWLKAWPTRASAHPYMLFPMVQAHWQLGNIAEALTAGEQAFELEPDASTEVHFLFFSMGSLVQGRTGTAAQVLRHVNPATLAAPFEAIYRTAAALVQLLADEVPRGEVDSLGDATDDSRRRSTQKPSYAEARQQLVEASAPLAEVAKENDRIAARMLHLSRAALARHYGKTLSTWWHRSQAWLV